MASAEIVGRDLDAKRAQLVQDSSSQTTDGAGDERHPPPTVGGPNKAAGGPRKIPDHRVSGSWQPDGPGFQLVNAMVCLSLACYLTSFGPIVNDPLGQSLGAISWGNLLGRKAQGPGVPHAGRVGGLARCFGVARPFVSTCTFGPAFARKRAWWRDRDDGNVLKLRQCGMSQVVEMPQTTPRKPYLWDG
jgi:hypothetical protein